MLRLSAGHEDCLVANLHVDGWVRNSKTPTTKTIQTITL